jgi:hypothetical protein
VSKKRRGDKFSGSPLAVGKTDAFAFLLREKFSVSKPSVCASPFFRKLACRDWADARELSNNSLTNLNGEFFTSRYKKKASPEGNA